VVAAPPPLVLFAPLATRATPNQIKGAPISGSPPTARAFGGVGALAEKQFRNAGGLPTSTTHSRNCRNPSQDQGTDDWWKGPGGKAIGPCARPKKCGRGVLSIPGMLKEEARNSRRGTKKRETHRKTESPMSRGTPFRLVTHQMGQKPRRPKPQGRSPGRAVKNTRHSWRSRLLFRQQIEASFVFDVWPLTPGGALGVLGVWGRPGFPAFAPARSKALPFGPDFSFSPPPATEKHKVSAVCKRTHLSRIRENKPETRANHLPRVRPRFRLWPSQACWGSRFSRAGPTWKHGKSVPRKGPCIANGGADFRIRLPVQEDSVARKRPGPISNIGPRADAGVRTQPFEVRSREGRSTVTWVGRRVGRDYLRAPRTQRFRDLFSQALTRNPVPGSFGLARHE